MITMIMNMPLVSSDFTNLSKVWVIMTLITPIDIGMIMTPIPMELVFI